MAAFGASWANMQSAGAPLGQRFGTHNSAAIRAPLMLQSVPICWRLTLACHAHKQAALFATTTGIRHGAEWPHIGC